MGCLLDMPRWTCDGSLDASAVLQGGRVRLGAGCEHATLTRYDGTIKSRPVGCSIMPTPFDGRLLMEMASRARETSYTFLHECTYCSDTRPSSAAQ